MIVILVVELEAGGIARLRSFARKNVVLYAKLGMKDGGLC